MSRRADRLFRLIDLLRGRRLAVTAATLAETLEVSPRTIYRDIADLIGSGVPISGEAGIGYLLDTAYELPPVMFSRDEVQALITGLRMVRAFTDPGLALAASRAQDKLVAVLDDTAKRAVEAQPYRVPILARDEPLRIVHGELRHAIEEGAKVALHYSDAEGAITTRIVWPFGIIGWQGRWTLLAWCEMRRDYRNFRLDRIQRHVDIGEFIPKNTTHSLKSYLLSLTSGPGG